MRALDGDELRAIVTDPAELAKGAAVLADGGLVGLARHGDRLFADALGAMAAPYKVMVTLGERVTARCTCMAARTRPFCKHAAALLVAWARTPEAFAEAEGAPVAPGERRRKRSVKKGKLDDAALMGEGAARAIALVRELAITGVASVGEGRAAALRGLAEGLRAGKLRRLGGRVHRLAEILDRTQAGARLDVEAYVDLLVDVMLTARRIEKHVAGEPLEARHVEELIGKTWRKADRAPIEDLDLIEYASRTETTPDGFVLRELRWVDVRTGAHYTDKQILPAFLARRTPAHPSLAGKVARGAAGRLYPGYAPRRIDLESRGRVDELDDAALAAVEAAALPGAAAALAAFQEHRKDLFAPDALPVTVRVDAVVPGERLRAADASGEALHLPDDALLEDQLAAALRGAPLHAIVGDLVLDRALPVLVPRAVIAGEPRALVRVTSAAEAMVPRRRGKARHHVDVDSGDWAAQARAAGASRAAVSLAEVRGEVDDRLAQGVGSFTARAVEPLASRLRELGLERPAQLLAGVADKPESERLEDVVRIHQVLGVALLRVIGTTTIDRAALIPVPTHPSILVDPRTPDRWTALIAAAREVGAIPPRELLAQPYPWWSHAGMSQHVADAVAREPGAIDAARAVLDAGARAGRIARMTAVRILVAADPDAAAKHVAQVLGSRPVGGGGPAGFAREARGGGPAWHDAALGSFALDQIDAARARAGDPAAALERRQRRLVASDYAAVLARAGTADDRRRAAHGLGDIADEASTGALRQAWLLDPSDDVREAAAIALGRRGDPEAIDSFTTILTQRDDDRAARAAALGLGQAGDTRGAEALVAALAAGWRPALVAECLRACGTVALPPLRAALTAQPALGKRKTFKELLAEERA